MAWFYDVGMQFYGPVDSAELRHLRATGVVGDHSLVYSDHESPRRYRCYQEIASSLAPAAAEEVEVEEDGRPSEFFRRDGKADPEIWQPFRRKAEHPF